ncbi:MAG: hypothetical protein R2751_02685 [Bacteroidales bacterium]
MRKLILFVSTISLFACSKTDDNMYQYYWGGLFEFSVYNSQNEDLLDPATLDHYDTSGIKLYYEVDGMKEEIYDPNLDYPRHFSIYHHEDEYRLQVSLNASDTSEKPITYIQWNNVDTDTIEVLFKRTVRSTLKRSVWLNGQLIWEWTLNEEGYHKIIKNIP